MTETTPEPVISPREARAVRINVGKLPHNRLYALDDVAERQMIALLRAAERAVGESFNDAAFLELLQRIAPHVPSMTQTWRPPEKEPVLPEMPRDAVTGMVAANPYVRDDPPSVASRKVLEAKEPALAKHLKRLAKDGGFTFAHLYEREAARARREALRRVRYGETQHQNNPFLVSDAVGAQSEFTLTHDPLTVEVHRLEAKPVRFPWGSDSTSLGGQGDIFDDLRERPTTAGIGAPVVLDAVKVDKNLVTALRLQAEQEMKAAAARAAALKRKAA